MNQVHYGEGIVAISIDIPPVRREVSVKNQHSRFDSASIF